MKNQLNTKTLVFTALLIALSYLGSLVKIFGSVALDALPAYFGALMLGGPIGALIGAVSCALFLTVIMGLLVKSGAMEQGDFGGPVAQLLRSIAERIV